MAFKIESIQEMKSIADTITQYAEDAMSESNKVIDAVEQLDTLVSGQGVDESLTKLKESVSTNAQSATNTLKYVSLFIKSQATSYAQNEEETSSTLNNVQSTLDSIVI